MYTIADNGYVVKGNYYNTYFFIVFLFLPYDKSNSHEILCLFLPILYVSVLSNIYRKYYCSHTTGYKVHSNLHLTYKNYSDEHTLIYI